MVQYKRPLNINQKKELHSSPPLCRTTESREHKVSRKENLPQVTEAYWYTRENLMNIELMKSSVIKHGDGTQTFLVPSIFSFL